MSTTHTESVDQTVTQAMEAGSIPAITLAIVQDGRLSLARGYGLTNLEHTVPAAAHTVFKIASITKTFTAMAVMMLVEHGKMDLDERVSGYLPGLPASWSPITVRHLLSHTSGIRSYEALLLGSWQPDDPYEQIVRSVAELPLAFSPGKAWSYSNANYVGLGVLIERVTGMPYRDFVRQEILIPVGMTETYWNNAAEIVPHRAQGYAWDSETLRDPGHPPLRNREKQSAVWDYADGGLLSTVVDLAKWDAVLYTEELLQRSTMEQMWTPARLSDGRAAEYGLGWIVKAAEGHRNIGHWGRNPSFIAGMCRFLDDGLTVIVLCNRWKADLWPLVIQIGNLYLPGVAADSLPRLF